MCLLKEQGGMGFRDLKTFNLALLAKQGWKLQNYSNSLFYQVFKAKYLPHTNFVDAITGSHPSYVWRSILVAQGIVRKGLRRRVGNGESIHIWQDSWLPSPTTYKVSSPVNLLPSDAKAGHGVLWMWFDRLLDAIRSPSLLEKVAAICWGIWKNRCEVRHRGHRRSSSDIARNSLVSLEEFQAANELFASPIVKEIIKWSPPPPPLGFRPIQIKRGWRNFLPNQGNRSGYGYS
ncbi:hypothetical protein SO802_017079 [Lithocarpus litseifolius]|uniref:Uncharacterized protein n=1 Tax=Lithocarpus litseifolius TaxID=425828 RepID=A0AAW2D0H6_9ROSI